MMILKYLYSIIDIKYNLYNKLRQMNQYNQINNIIYMIQIIFKIINLYILIKNMLMLLIVNK